MKELTIEDTAADAKSANSVFATSGLPENIWVDDVVNEHGRSIIKTVLEVARWSKSVFILQFHQINNEALPPIQVTNVWAVA